jgi:pyruvate/2-oxoglutarate/acetoin dehydrogenase E1 component
VPELSFREAIRDGLAEEMERDPAVVVMGEDVEPGGVFNVTPGLRERFGPKRVVDTPISELAFTGAAFGAAVKGLRPVVEIMFGDFLGLVIDTLVNQSSKYWFLSNEQASVPLVVRSAVGAGARFGACHSQTPTGFFLGEPGLKVVAPSTPADAKGLIKAAIRDDNPVIVFEHKMLYGRKAEVPEDGDVTPIGRAAVRRRGGDVTLVAALAATETALTAAEELAGTGIEAEVLDLRTLRPLDSAAIAESAARTGRLVVVEEGPPTGGYAGEVISAAVELAGPLRARRVTMPDLPVPYSPPLEDSVIPSAAKVVAAARALLGEAA